VWLIAGNHLVDLGIARQCQTDIDQYAARPAPRRRKARWEARSEARSFRGSWMGFAHCDFTRRDITLPIMRSSALQ
jgi:hypothetical protein